MAELVALREWRGKACLAGSTPGRQRLEPSPRLPGESRYGAVAMIHKHSNETATRWDRGEFKVQLMLTTNSGPMGYCDGTPEDAAELRAMAESEGAGQMHIDKKLLKTGREIWTMTTEEL